MRKTYNLLSQRHFLPLLIVLILGVLAARTLLFQSGYFTMHDDLQMMRQLQMEKCFQDLQIPCRWVPDMGYGYGFPLFNFYPPLPYLIGQVFRVVGFSFIATVKLTFALSIIASGMFMYLLSKEFFGRIGGILSAAFYIWAPYHAVDVYVRGAMNEAWALAWFPLIMWSGYRLVKSSQDEAKRGSVKWIMLLSLSWAALLLTHNLMVLVFAPVFAGWILILLLQNGAWKKIALLILAGVWALGLAAFFTIPAVMENQYTQINDVYINDFDFRGHFVSSGQLLVSRFWGYGGSFWMEEDDGMSFAIGHMHWILSLFVGLILIFRANIIFRNNGFKGILKDRILLPATFLLLVGWFSAFLTHSRSTPIWLTIDQLKYLQFPWRLLTVIILAFSFAAGYIPALFRSDKRLISLALTPLRVFTAILLILAVVALNWNYFLPAGGKMGNLTDEEKFSKEAWRLQTQAGIKDYLPITAKTDPTSPADELVEILDGTATINEINQGTNWAVFNVNIESQEATLRINLFDFPGWKIYANEKEINKFIPGDESWGRMHITLPGGEQEVEARFTNTPPRTAGNMISLGSWLLLAGLILKRRFVR
jgi:hypothetical protein